jgi:glycine/D-amino acid oxidase-like deaminating enzyme
MSHHPSQDRADPPRVYAERAAPPPSPSVLERETRAEVAVIGAGYTGLSAALHLAEAGADVAVVEARQVGWGASGRAFGQVVPYLKHGQAEILAQFGAERGQRIIDAVAAGPDMVFGLIDKHGIACDAVRTGLIFAAHAPVGRRGLEARTEYWRSRGAAVEMLDAAGSEAAIGSRLYEAASLDWRGGHLNPLAYARGLAQAAARLGVRFYAGAPVTAVRREEEDWVLAVPGGAVRARAVAIGTNAYTNGFWPGLRQSVVPMRGHALVSAPMSDNLRRTVLPGGQPLTDTRRLFSGVRVLAGGHLHVSLDGAAFGAEAPPFIATAEARIARLYPQLGALRWQESWSGWIAMTTDHYPRVHELAPGVFAGLGYSGRGIAAATIIGREIALRLGGAEEDALAFPLSPLRPIPLHGLARLPAEAALRAYRYLDKRDERAVSR